MRFRLGGKKKADAAPSETAKQEASSACPKCSAVLPAGARVCPYCGAKLDVEGSTEAAPEGARSLKRSALLLLRDIGVAVLIVLIILGAIYAYTRVWPPMVVIESNSMQHDNGVSYIGVIDTGDLVLVQTAPLRADVTTYVEGRATGYRTYSNFGDVIIFRKPNYETPIIHRPILWMDYNPATKKFNITALENPALAGLWGGTYANSTPVRVPRDLDGTIWIKNAGWREDMNLTIRISTSFIGSNPSSPRYQRGGYVTLGDNNRGNYDEYLVRQEDIYGKARGEIPWFGLIKLTLAPSPGACCHGWGDPYAPKNSWDSLVISLILIIITPIIVDVSFALWHRRRDRKAESAKDEPKVEPPKTQERHEIPPVDKTSSETGTAPIPPPPQPQAKASEQGPDKPSV